MEMLGQPQGDCGFSLPLAQLGFQTSHLSERRPANTMLCDWHGGVLLKLLQQEYIDDHVSEDHVSLNHKVRKENILVLGGLSSQ